MMRRHPSAALSIASVVVLCGLAAAASHTSVWAASREGTAPLPGLMLIVAVISVLGSASVATVTVALHRGRKAERPLRKKMLQRVPGTIVGIALVSLVAISRVDLQSYRAPGAEVGSVDLSGREGVRLRMDWGGDAVRRAGEAEGSEQAEVVRPDGPPVLLWMILMAGVVGAVALATAWWSTRRPAPARSLEQTPAGRREAARMAVIGTIDAMLVDPDPHTAIIGAYARLLEELSAKGARRWDHEGPMEHLHRVLTVLEVRPEPLERLTRLFEEARFSTHRLSPWHRDRALDALREVAVDLGAPSAAQSASAGSTT